MRDGATFLILLSCFHLGSVPLRAGNCPRFWGERLSPVTEFEIAETVVVGTVVDLENDELAGPPRPSTVTSSGFLVDPFQFDSYEERVTIRVDEVLKGEAAETLELSHRAGGVPTSAPDERFEVGDRWLFFFSEPPRWPRSCHPHLRLTAAPSGSFEPANRAWLAILRRLSESSD